MELFVILSERIREPISFNVNLEPLKEFAKKALDFLVIYAQAEAAKKKKPGNRKAFLKSVKQAVLARQLKRCNFCRRCFPDLEFHHKDGNHSNNDISNCEALCPNCHARKTKRSKRRVF